MVVVHSAPRLAGTAEGLPEQRNKPMTTSLLGSKRSALERKLPIFPVLVEWSDHARKQRILPDDFETARVSAKRIPFRHDSFFHVTMFGAGSKRLRTLGIDATEPGRWPVISGLFIILSGGKFLYYVWAGLPLTSSKRHTRRSEISRALGEAEYPDSWGRGESIHFFVLPYGWQFSERCPKTPALTLGARKRSKTVIHGNTARPGLNECWLAAFLWDLRPHIEFHRC